jgi:hypothetical protein
VTDLGIEKQPREPHFLVDTKRVVTLASARLDARQPSAGPAGPTSCCG